MDPSPRVESLAQCFRYDVVSDQTENHEPQISLSRDLEAMVSPDEGLEFFCQIYSLESNNLCQRKAIIS